METNSPEPSPNAQPAKPMAAPTRPTKPVASKPPRRGGGGIFTGMLVLVALLFSGYSLWRVEQSRAPVDSGQGKALTAMQQQVDDSNQASAQLRGDLDNLRQRFRDADAVNKGLREEMLGISERSRHLDDAIANLAEQRLTGRDALALNEAEFLLMMANERYQLFGDSAAAVQALQLADSALAASQDPVFSSVRATIKAERDAIGAASDGASQATLRALARIADDVAHWPMLSGAMVDDQNPDASRLSRVFSRFVRIRHDDDTLAAREPTLARSLLRIDLQTAAAAWLARDGDDYQAAMQRVRNDIVGSFDGSTAPVQAALAEVDRLSAQTIAPALPVLGTALKELRDLRATRALSRQSAEPMTAPVIDAPPESSDEPVVVEPAVTEPADVEPAPEQTTPPVEQTDGGTP